MTFNLELAKTVRELIRLHPEQHNQYEWSTNHNKNPAENCGTSACIAGWVAAARGRTVADVESEEMPDGPRPGTWYISSWAQNELGLTEEQHDSLFWELNNEAALVKLDHLIETNGEADCDALEDAAGAIYGEDKD